MNRTMDITWCHNVARNLGPGWVAFQEMDRDNEPRWWITLRRGDLLTLHVSREDKWREPPETCRIIVTGNKPRDPAWSYYFSREMEALTQKITMAPDTTPEKAAKQIVSRLLPDFQRLHNYCVEKIAKARDHRSKLRQQVCVAAAAFGVEPPKEEAADRFYPHRAACHEVQVNADGIVSLSRFSFPIDKLPAVLAAAT